MLAELGIAVFLTVGACVWILLILPGKDSHTDYPTDHRIVRKYNSKS